MSYKRYLQFIEKEADYNILVIDNCGLRYINEQLNKKIENKVINTQEIRRKYKECNPNLPDGVIDLYVEYDRRSSMHVTQGFINVTGKCNEQTVDITIVSMIEYRYISGSNMRYTAIPYCRVEIRWENGYRACKVMHKEDLRSNRIKIEDEIYMILDNNKGSA